MRVPTLFGNSFGQLTGGLILLLSCVLHGAEDQAAWRLFTARDGLAETFAAAITISPRNTVWIRHSEGAGATRMDGYETRLIPSPGEGKSPVYESRSGQIWCLSADGLLEFSQGRWNSYPIEEIRVENAANVRRRVHPIPLVPAERDHVFFVIPEGLYRFDASQRQAQLVLKASESNLGAFLDMIESRSGGLLISANKGLLQLPGPLRRLTSRSVPERHALPAAWELSSLDRPIEDDAGGVTVSALTTSTPVRRVLTRFDGRAWELVIPEADRLRQGWRDPDGGFWAMSREKLTRIESGQTRAVLQAGTLAGYHNDVAVGTNGMFWVGTQEGVLFHAPRPWRAPTGLGGLIAPSGGLTEDAEGRVWFLSADGLRLVKDGQSRVFAWPDDPEASLQPTDRLCLLADGRLILGRGDRVWFFDPKSSQFSEPEPLPGRRVIRLLGPLRNGSAAVLVRRDGSNQPGLQVERHDGLRTHPLFVMNPEWPVGQDVVFVSETANQDLWVGASTGIGLLHENRLQWFGPAQGYTAGRASCWLEVGEGRVWCGGVETIFEFDGRAWTQVRGGFDRVHAMVRSQDGSIYVATGNGLHRFFRDSWVSASTEEGLPSPTVTSVAEDRRGRLWAATSFGLSVYHPRADTDPPHTSVAQAGGEPGIARNGAIKFTVSGSDRWNFTLPSRLLFSHRLDNGPWLPYSSDNSITFKELGPGKHTLQVRAMDRDWNVDPNPIAMVFQALVPWYRVPSMVAMVAVATALIAFLAWVALNRHLRLRRSLASIERIVQERTAALNRANQELLHSQKMKALGTLAAGVAHDFNQILSIIKGSAQIIEGHLHDPDKVRTRAQRIQTVVDQGTGIVRAMLGLSRQGPRDLAPCHVNQIVREVVRLLGDRFLDEVRVKLDLQRGLPAVRASDDLAQQMLLNLAVNAADAMGGHGEITVRTVLLEKLPTDLVLEPAEARQHVGITVTDHGSGIAADVLPRIFEPFFTTKSFSSRRGTGLGLSMVYEFAKELGAGLRVESQVNRGSSFTIILPSADPAAEGGSHETVD